MKNTTPTAGFEPITTFARSDEKRTHSSMQYIRGTIANARATAAVPNHIEAEQQRAESLTDSPNDPQNWPPWHKHLTYGTICLFSFMANINASAFTVAVRPLSLYFHISATAATALTALNVLMFGLGNFLWVPLMRVIGKRPVYLLALAILIVANAWSARAGTYGSLLAARMVSGLGASAADATVPSVVADLYAHGVRGRMGMWFHFALASGIFLGPLINAWVIFLHGWRWVPGWMAVVFGGLFVVGLVTIHETEWRRPKDGELPTVEAEEEEEKGRSFVGRMSLTLGLQRDQPVKAFTTCLRDIVAMLAYPLIIWPSLVVGVFVGWTIIIQITVGQTFTLPPYRWTLGQVGLFHLAGFIGVLFSFPFGGIVVDWFVRKIMRKNKVEKANPKHRLVALAIPGTIAPAGLIIYGIMLGRHEGWVGPAFGYAMHSFGFAAISNIVVVFAIDCYRGSAGEGFVSLFVIRNVIAVVCSFEESNWIQDQGMGKAFGTMAGVEWGLLALGALIYAYTPKLLWLSERYGPEKRRKQRMREGRGEVVELPEVATQANGPGGDFERIAERA